jgi:hypothetical protein
VVAPASSPKVTVMGGKAAARLPGRQAKVKVAQVPLPAGGWRSRDGSIPSGPRKTPDALVAESSGLDIKRSRCRGRAESASGRDVMLIRRCR